MHRLQIIPLGLLVFFGVACSDAVPIPTDPVPGIAVFNHHGGPPGGGGPPGRGGGGGGPVALVVRVSNSPDNEIRGDQGGEYSEYRHDDECIRAVRDGSKLLEFASALTQDESCRSGEWRGLLFPAGLFTNTDEPRYTTQLGVGDLPEAGIGMRRGAVENLNVFNDGTFNMWIRAVDEDGHLLTFSKWNLSHGTVTTTEEDGWTVVRLHPGAAQAEVNEGYFGREHPNHGLQVRWSDRGSHPLPLELRFRPL